MALCSATELEAALEELRLIRELQPPANSRGRPQEHGFYLRRRGEEFVVSRKPGPLSQIAGPPAGIAGRARTCFVHGRRGCDQLRQGGPLPTASGADSGI